MLESGFIEDIARGSRLWDVSNHASEDDALLGAHGSKEARLTSSIYLEDALCN